MEKVDEKKKVNKYWRFVFHALMVALSGAAGGMAFKNFFERADIIPSGLSGFAMLVQQWLEPVAYIPTAVIYLVLNLVLFALSFKCFGWKFLVLSGIGMGTYTLAMQFGDLSSIIALTEHDKLLFAIVGACLCGLCVGLALKFGGSTGGSDIAGTLINRICPKIKVGTSVLIINAMVIILSIITKKDITAGLYALLSAVISSISTNLVLDVSKRVVAYYIVCEKDEEIAAAILKRYHRGVTRIDATGMFSNTNKKLILCLVPSDQSYKIKEFVKNIDDRAFVFSAPVNETVGQGNFLKEYTDDKRANFKTGITKTKKKLKHFNNIKSLNLKRKQKRFKANKKH